jgi:hypothetical protein
MSDVYMRICMYEHIYVYTLSKFAYMCVLIYRIYIEG